MSATRVDAQNDLTAMASSSTAQNQQAEPSKRKSSTLRFTSDSNGHTQSSKSERRGFSSSDESTPIRQSNNNVSRSYNTSDTTLPVPTPPAIASTTNMSQPTESSDSTKVETSTAWYKKLAEKYGSVTLENKASVARDHLALERTFLAWLRTSLSFASIGVAITQLFRLNSSLSRPSKRFVPWPKDHMATASEVPFAPYLGHAIPAEVLPYLQNVVPAQPDTSGATLGPTLLDQLLMLASDGTPVETASVVVSSFNVDAATRLKSVGKPLGATFIGISVLVLLVGFQRYFEAQHWIIQGKFPASRGSVTLVAFVAFALIIASLVVIIVVSPSSYET